MRNRISVCIPTCNRPHYFEEALRSVLDQERSVLEVLVGDDSTDDRTGQTVHRYLEEGAPIRYVRNKPPMGQARNVDSLFERAEGELILLLHDDDRLIPDALATLQSCFDAHPDIVAAFGKQQIIDTEGKIKWATTHGVNEGYDRIPEHEGRQSSSLQSAIIQQFPNDGYMIRADSAQEIGYYHSGASDACDMAFGIALARNTDGDFFYTDTYTSQYRQSKQSVARGDDAGDAAYHSFRIVLEEVAKDIQEEPRVEDWLRRKAPVAIMNAAEQGFAQEGLQWFFGKHHRHRIPTLGGVRRFVHLVSSLITSTHNDSQKPKPSL